MADSNKKEVIDSLLSGMDAVLSSKTVVGQPVVVGDTTIIPLVDVSFGVAAGSGNESRNYNKNSSAGGMGGKVSPNAIIVIKDGKIEASGTQEELLAKSALYRQMWDTHMAVKEGA